jgi:hypothetical protein
MTPEEWRRRIEQFFFWTRGWHGDFSTVQRTTNRRASTRDRDNWKVMLTGDNGPYLIWGITQSGIQDGFYGNSVRVYADDELVWEGSSNTEGENLVGFDNVVNPWLHAAEKLKIEIKANWPDRGGTITVKYDRFRFRVGV